ncbi:helix-turn-helix domain-containing protein [Pseudorhodoplanes sinuspersici]|uniref:Uncharacterized protein n=1 Tax=Pseudorhodoplanes sinuspersici TaxID=1235591 RepID=A0A1W6ZNB9_9HYPH|nr:helix-turn-helix transcriptional regulator [Pseudorhodoplanes sinuspersici]ARP98284.1 hypothetical protein CAK95_03660 [Pseudorhodoplanes sinuspersici]RKE65937.1 transcriptional regulator with XRE-family HTH domain [Pseudorhodoplanes sinuspersici]
MPRKEPDPIDLLVGRNIRILRMKQGMSQETLANALSLTFQQVQKYEKGTNRVGSGRLHKIAGILKVSIATLFEGADAKADSARSSLDLLADPHALRVVQAMSEITDSRMRRSIVDLVEQIAAGAALGGVKPRSEDGIG